MIENFTRCILLNSYKAFCLFSCLILSSCILTTTDILRDAIKNIVKEDAQVVNLMGPGIDPHIYQTTQKDVQQLRRAHIIFYNGLDLEDKMTDLLQRMSKERKAYAVSEALNKTELLYGPIGVDPHIWFDVRLWKQVVSFIGQKLQEARPVSAAYYQNNTLAYIEALKQLHQSVTTQIQSIRAKQRVLIIAHDAFGCLSKAYNIEVVGLQGVSTIPESGLKNIKNIVELVIERNIKAVFFETSVSDKSMQAVVEGCAHYGHKVVVGGCLYSDALGASDTIEGTYCGMVRSNATTIVNALK
ncbi:metal ABC transporter solute-binding protein, Zn/Mn family [Cardinium endosymbiont of Oedothorax gibbosus]|uniref:metal ABC transporter solute-binding protein, Zn/Mn family n=1 Tax=Cardinium endosymbiont of Oedothorax gibbosus TaxID=931101 RepID=UPI002111538B|nr:zinc ABC transporter substrate-binding protein [Cardinium endosymbiont of Oedothorax gibbosus]CAH2559920.1 Putative metal transport system solute-binding protein [Cardinium endosymbiont of Oedothorax gibbosus]